MSERTFAPCYCEQRGIPPDDFVPAVMRETLYPHLRWVAVALAALRPSFFAADRELIAEAGRLKDWAELELYMSDLVRHPSARNPLRRFLRLRISVKRLRRVMRETLAEQRSSATAGLPRSWI